MFRHIQPLVRRDVISKRWHGSNHGGASYQSGDGGQWHLALSVRGVPCDGMSKQPEIRGNRNRDPVEWSREGRSGGGDGNRRRNGVTPLFGEGATLVWKEGGKVGWGGGRRDGFEHGLSPWHMKKERFCIEVLSMKGLAKIRGNARRTGRRRRDAVLVSTATCRPTVDTLKGKTLEERGGASPRRGWTLGSSHRVIGIATRPRRRVGAET